MAKEIVRKYKDLPGESLLPFLTTQKYNDDIKKEIVSILDKKD